jgi:phage anti-repressor protein
MELIKITSHEGSQAVNARELYEYLGYSPAQWKRWYTKNIEKDDWFTESEDYWGFDIVLNGLNNLG